MNVSSIVDSILEKGELNWPWAKVAEGIHTWLATDARASLRVTYLRYILFKFFVYE